MAISLNWTTKTDIKCILPDLGKLSPVLQKDANAGVMWPQDDE